MATKRLYTEEEIRKLFEMWPNHTLVEIGAKLKRGESSILDLAEAIRRAGYNLPPKSNTERLYRKIKNAIGDVGKN